jgi:phosphatidylinositol phosphate synthase
MALRDTVLADYFYRAVEKLVLPRTERFLKKPKHYTVAGLACATVVPIGFYVHPGLGLIFIILSGAIDGMDGAVARKTGRSSAYGAFIDSNADRLADFFYLIGFWVLFLESKQFMLATFLISLGILFSFMISYIKARAEGLGEPCEIGLMERGWRTLYLIGWAFLLCVLPGAKDVILWSGLIMLCVLTLATGLQRFLHVSGNLKQ